MKVTAESLFERYSAMNTEALRDLYHESELTDLAVNVLEDVVTSRGLEWAEFTARADTESVATSNSDENWSLWKSKDVQASIDEKNPTVANVGQPVKSVLVGIEGWLFIYTILRSLGAVLVGVQLRVFPDVEGRLAGAFSLTLILVGLYLLIKVRKPITRNYHIGFNGFFAAIFGIFAILTPSLPQWLAFAESFAWVMYWIRSQRVRATYCRASGTVVSR